MCWSSHVWISNQQRCQESHEASLVCPRRIREVARSMQLLHNLANVCDGRARQLQAIRPHVRDESLA